MLLEGVRFRKSRLSFRTKFFLPLSVISPVNFRNTSSPHELIQCVGICPGALDPVYDMAYYWVLHLALDPVLVH